uniref:Uncharacterized protein n=1 Tax=Anguilla anguilla TaxID=7936 RepID=A0A0E9XYN8_ANGAN
MEANLCSNASTSSFQPSQKCGSCCSLKGWINAILMPTILDEMLDFTSPHTSGHYYVTI